MKIKIKMRKVFLGVPVFGLVHIPSIIVRVLEMWARVVHLHQARIHPRIIQLHQNQQRNRKEKETKIRLVVSPPY